MTELVVALVVRTRRSVFKSRPGTLLLVSTVVLIPLTLAIPFLPNAGAFDFVPLTTSVFEVILAVTTLYFAAAETAKHVFYRSGSNR